MKGTSGEISSKGEMRQNVPMSDLSLINKVESDQMPQASFSRYECHSRVLRTSNDRREGIVLLDKAELPINSENESGD